MDTPGLSPIKHAYYLLWSIARNPDYGWDWATEIDEALAKLELEYEEAADFGGKLEEGLHVNA